MAKEMSTTAAPPLILEDRHIAEISKKIEEWECFAPHLEISEAEIAAIRGGKRTSDQKKIDLLRIWKRVYGDKATYQMLVEAAQSSGESEVVKYIKSLPGMIDKRYGGKKVS